MSTIIRESTAERLRATYVGAAPLDAEGFASLPRGANVSTRGWARWSVVEHDAERTRRALDMGRTLSVSDGLAAPDCVCDGCGATNGTATAMIDGFPLNPIFTFRVHSERAGDLRLTLAAVRARTRLARGGDAGSRLGGTVDIHLCTSCMSYRIPCDACGDFGHAHAYDAPAERTLVYVWDGGGNDYGRAVALCPECNARVRLNANGMLSSAVECTGCHAQPRNVHAYANDFQSVADSWACNSCSACCSDCDELGLRQDYVYLNGGGTVCQSCARHYQECEDCGTLCRGSDLVGTRCCNCVASARRSVIGDYHSAQWNARHALASTWSAANGGRFFGVELEIEARDRNTDVVERARVLLDAANMGGVLPDRAGAFKMIHAEHDGSLQNGFELVSRPLDLPSHRLLWSRVLSGDNVRGLRSHRTDTCGLHVHLTRSSLSKLQLSRMSVCVNSPLWERLITTVARRYRVPTYCHVAPKTLGGALSRESYGKYDALNVSRSHTVEFRIFRGSLDAAAVIAAVEFTHALAEFCGMPSWAPAGDLSPVAFTAFLSLPEMRQETRTLRAYLARRGWAGVEAKETRPRGVSAPALAACTATNEDDAPAAPVSADTLVNDLLGF